MLGVLFLLTAAPAAALAPAVPANFALQASSHGVAVTWTPSSGAQSYQINYGPNSGNFGILAPVLGESVAKTAIAGLSYGTTYKFRMRACTASVLFSSELDCSAWTATKTATPSGPGSLTTISLSWSTAGGWREGSSGTVTARLDHPAAAAYRVYLHTTASVGNVSTTATSSDYSLSPGYITIAKGKTTGSLRVTIVDDTEVEGHGEAIAFTPGTVVLDSDTSSEVSIPTKNGVVIRILDNEPTVSLSASPNPVSEGSPVTVTARLSRTLTGNVTIPITLTAGTAESGDYGTLTSITINSGSTTGTGTVTTAQDTDADDETFTVALGTMLPTSVGRGSAPLTVTITEPQVQQQLQQQVQRSPQPQRAEPADDGSPSPEKSAPGPLAGIALSAGSEAVALSPAFAPGTVSYRVEVPTGATKVSLTPTWGGTSSVFAGARAPGAGGKSYTRPTRVRSSGTAVELNLAPDGGPTEIYVLVFGAGGTRTTYEIESTVASETVAKETAAEESGTDTAPIQEILGTVSFVSDSYRIKEPTFNAIKRSLVVQVVRSGDTSAAAGGITATLTDVTAGDWDYVGASPLPLRFEAGQSTTAITYSARDDPFFEDDETFTVTLTADAGSGYRVGSPSTATVTIVDGTLGVRFAQNAYTVTEGGTAEVTINMSTSADVSVPLEVSVADSTAIHGSDYSGPQTISVSIPAGDTSKTFSIPIRDDSEVEQPETFTLTLKPAPNLREYHVRAPSVATITIRDNDDERAPPEEETETQQRDPLTASFERAPSEHAGSDSFWLNLRFSEALGEGGKAPAAASFDVRNGKVKRVRQVEPGLWRVRVVPASWRDLTVTLAGGRGCDAKGAVCASDGRALSNTSRASIGGPARIRLSGGKAREGAGASIGFAVTLSRAAAHEVSVDYATKDGTAVAGEDYTAASGTLVFAAGETDKTVTVALLDDAHDEGKETFTLGLSNPKGAYLRGMHRGAKGVIRNADPIPQAWLAQFGRTAASDAIAAVTARFGTPRDAGSHFTLGGHRLPFGTTGETGGMPAAPMGGSSGGDPLGWAEDGHAGSQRAISVRELLMGTSFRAVLGQGAGSQFTSWGQGASVSRFSGAVPGLSLSGETATGSLGMDYERGRLLAGFAMTHSLGEGTAHGAGRRYAMGSTVTTMLPYARLRLSDRLSAWGLAGTGAGDLTLDLDDDAAKRHRADLSMTLAAMGVRGDLLTPAEAGGFALALKADAFWVRTESDSVSAPGVGNLAAARADATRLRAVLHGSRTFSLADGGTLAPNLELGVRHDGGDAETGTGLELGAGLGWSDPSRGLDMALKVHGLAVHAEDGYGEWGVSGQLRLVPGGAGRGLSASLTPSYGVDPGGSERLWMQPDASGFAANGDAAPSSRFDAEVGYGMALFGDRFTGTPNLGFGLSDTARDYRLGWRLTSAVPNDPGFEVNLDVTRREAVNDNDADHGVLLRSLVRW